MLSGNYDPPGLRARKKARTREAIVDAALDLFERKGFEATTVEDIAAAADVSPRTFFRYFETKFDVVLAKNVEKGEGLGELIAARPAGETPLEAVRQVIQAQLSAMVEDTDDVALRELKVVMRTPELRTRALDHFHEHQTELLEVIAARLGVSEDALPAHVLAGVIGTSLWAVVDRWVAGGAHPEQLTPMIDEAFDMLAKGFDSCCAALADGAAGGLERPA
jgi:AcrR family transcriptional regulator